MPQLRLNERVQLRKKGGIHTVGSSAGLADDPVALDPQTYTYPQWIAGFAIGASSSGMRRLLIFGPEAPDRVPVALDQITDVGIREHLDAKLAHLQIPATVDPLLK